MFLGEYVFLAEMGLERRKASHGSTNQNGAGRVLRTDHGSHPQLKGAHTVHMTHN